METLNKIGKFFLAFIWLINAIGGTAMHLYRGDAAFAIFNIIVSLCMLPDIIATIKDIING